MSDETSHLRENVEIKKLAVTRLEAQLSDSEKEERLNSILNRIGIQMTEWSRDLQLEHSAYPLRFDFNRLTTVVDLEDRPVPLSQLGSGENWVGIHIVTLLALHKHFIRNTRPVPNFLILDQPSQVYYPSEKDSELEGSLDSIADEDKAAVARMYGLIINVTQSLSKRMQVIVTDHADLSHPDFQDCVRERWRGENALVPRDWPASQ